MPERKPPHSERLLASFGLHPVAHRPPLSWRFWVYAITAYLLPVAVHVVFPSEAGTLDEVVWLVTLVPAFLLSLHFGLRGAFAALLVGIALLVGVQIFQVFVHSPGDPRITVPIFIAYGTLAISVGWLSEQLHAHYEYALQAQAERKTEVLGTMAAGIAHDFNNILTVMVANAEILAGRDEASRDEELEQLRSAAQRGAGMVRNLLGFSRRGVLSLRHVDLARVLDEQEPLIRRLIPGSVDLRVQVGPDLPPILADREALDRILAGLVTNARDAMPAGGALDIAVNSRRIDPEHLRRRGWGDPGDYVCLEVTDTGHGMDAETLDRIFEPFFTGKDEGEAVGLGMAMVYGVMKQHRGFVDVESARGAGTTVRLFFPVAKDRVVPSAAPPRPIRPQGGGETILLVEDDEPIRMAARRILERFGYKVLEAADGFEGEEVYRKHAGEIDLLLADVMLPKRTGPELYDVIRAGPSVPGAGPSAPRVLFMSGYPAHTVRTSAGLDPTLPFIQKPWTVDDFARAVRSTLDAEEAGR